MHSEYYVIGLMSGSSLDGLDIAYVKFTLDKKWNFELLSSKTADLGLWQNKLREATSLSEKDLAILSKEFAIYLAKEVEIFIQEHDILKLDLVASHGHTIYHYPHKGITCQIGDGEALSSLLGYPVVSNLRQADIDAGGQGAPIVPIGDLLLFSDYKYCLNLGGIANISSKLEGGITAYDICSANQVLNHFAKQLALPFDEGGKLAKSGQVSHRLLTALNEMAYYKLSPPKSLDNAFTLEVLKVIEPFELAFHDILATYTDHIAIQVEKTLQGLTNNSKVLVTGGGAFNTYLVERIAALGGVVVEVPKDDIVNYKEAIVMGFIGVLRSRNEVNVLASVTGAAYNTSCGEIHRKD